MAAPMPRVPPVTRALLAARSFVSGSAAPASRLTGDLLMAWLLPVSAEPESGRPWRESQGLRAGLTFPLGDSPPGASTHRPWHLSRFRGNHRKRKVVKPAA